jgi:hypothetical protein
MKNTISNNSRHHPSTSHLSILAINLLLLLPRPSLLPTTALSWIRTTPLRLAEAVREQLVVHCSVALSRRAVKSS